MRAPSVIAGCLILFFFGCSSNNTGNGSGAGFDDAQHSGDGGSGSSSATPGTGDACDQYLKCVGDAEPDALPAALAAYGPKGSCWGGSASLDATCENACASSMASEGAAHLDIASCGGAQFLKISNASAACSNCMTTTCGTPDNACAVDPICVDLFDCFETCHPAYFTGGGDPGLESPAAQACDDACTSKEANTPGLSKFNKLGVCMAGCTSVCGSGG